MTARIYKPARTAMQSGTAKTKEWVLDYEPEQPRMVEPLMGWTSSGDMKQECGCSSTPRKRRSPIASARAFPTRCSKRSRRRVRASPTPTISPIRAARPGRIELLSGPSRRLGSVLAPPPSGAADSGPCEAARWRSSEIKRSSGIGWPSRKPWP